MGTQSITWPTIWLWQKRLFALLLAWCLLANPQLMLAQSSTGTDYDPLSAEEAQAALDAAFAAGAAAGADSISAASVLRQEVLLVERRQEDKEDIKNGVVRRRSDTYIYDYTTDTLKHVIIDLDTQEVEVIEELQEVQLPLSGNEVIYAYYLAFSNEALRQSMNESYRQITGEELETASQLEIKSFIFTADAMPDAVNDYSEECGIHRCAQLLLYTKDNTILDVQPIIDLSRGIVAQDITNNTEDLHSEDSLDPDIGSESADDPVDAADVDETPAGDGANGGPASGSPTVGNSGGSTSLFLPFVSRRFLKNGLPPDELILDQVIAAWWCEWMSRTQYAEGIESICIPQEATE